MIAWFAAVVLASLLGSMHCAAMCGPIALWAAGGGCGGSAAPRRGFWPAAAAYHGGRLLTYCVLGAAAGLLGGGLDRSGGFVGLQRGAAVLAGGMMVAVGLAQLAPASSIRGVLGPLHSGLGRALARSRGRVAVLPRLPRAAAIGAMTGLLPCGWLYLFVLIAAGGGSAVGGAATMLAFWVGTVPWLTAAVAGAAGLSRSRGAALVKPLTAALIVAAGLSTMFLRSRVDLSGLKAVPLTDVSATTLPCCSHAAAQTR